MADKDELYISMDRNVYRNGKSNLLRCQTDMLLSLKRLYNLKVLMRQKNDLKKILHKLLSSVNSDINSIRGRMPTPEVPEEIVSSLEVVTVEVQEVKARAKKSRTKHDALEDELRAIQEKLTALNS